MADSRASGSLATLASAMNMSPYVTVTISISIARPLLRVGVDRVGCSDSAVEEEDCC